MSVVRAIQANLHIYFDESKDFARHGQVLRLLSPKRALYLALIIAYVLIQAVFILLFKPAPPKDEKLRRPFGRIAVVGAGLTGISSAAHCIAHNFDVVIFEADDRPGGIWAHVNKSSGLQLNSLLYRFHPGVLWSRAFPYRDEILGEITRIWKEYRLVSRTRFNTPVTSVCRADGTRSPDAKWLVNDGADGAFDAIIVTIGTCGEPQMIGFPGMPKRDENWHEKHSNKREDGAHGDADPREDGAPSDPSMVTVDEGAGDAVGAERSSTEVENGGKNAEKRRGSPV
ncbi:hypothetical protein EWM64_g5819 [Hericium alpestre]|uniref:FAD/NAD(P)-binding domain-containing protein n=1 Tax=Hericium alpestre TaxID=135208 RepID=A0A4Y9ZTQ7_9AGAM|nr:hypothetical protein EWM64_g5819 [Hericium alpestre]